MFFEKRGLRLRSDHDGLNSDHDANGQLSMLPIATEQIWHYQLDPGRSLGKTNPLNDEDLAEFVELQKSYKESERSWLVDVADVDRETFDLSVKNPNAPEEDPLREPEEILEEIAALDAESAEILAGIGEMV